MQPIAEDTRTPRAPLSPLSFWLLSVVVGIVAGLAAVVFRGMIALLHNLLFLRTLSAACDANLHTPASPWGALVVLVAVAGALGVAFLVKNFAPEAKGHGVPEVIALHLCHRYSGRALTEIGDRFGLSPSGVSEASRSGARDLPGRPEWKKRVDEIARGS